MRVLSAVAAILLTGMTVAPALASSDLIKGADRKPMQGEVKDAASIASVTLVGDTAMEVEVKLVNDGTFTIVGGYFKEGCFHHGITGKNYFAFQPVDGKAGDVKRVSINYPEPLANRKITAAVVTSANDICTTK